MFGVAANSTETMRFDNAVGASRIANNQVPATSAVTLNMIFDDTARTVTPNTNHVSLDMFGSTQSFGSVAGNVDIRNHTASLTIGANKLSTVYTGSMYGASFGTASAGSLTKVGSGTQTLSGNYSYTGLTNINGGTLLIGNGTGPTGTASLGNTAVTVGNGALTATLGGNGTINGAVTVTSTGHLAPAMSSSTTNTLTIANNLTLNTGATLDFNFGAASGSNTPGTSDTVNVTGNGNILLNAGTDVLNINPQTGFGTGIYNLLTLQSTGAFTDNATFSINGFDVL